MSTAQIAPLKIICLNSPGQNFASQSQNFQDFFSLLKVGATF